MAVDPSAGVVEINLDRYLATDVTVCHPDGSPAARANVDLFPVVHATTPGWEQALVTDSRGRLRALLPKGRTRAVAYELSSGWNYSMFDAQAEGEESTAVDLSLIPFVEVSGRVKNLDRSLGRIGWGWPRVNPASLGGNLGFANFVQRVSKLLTQGAPIDSQGRFRFKVAAPPGSQWSITLFNGKKRGKLEFDADVRSGLEVELE